MYFIISFTHLTLNLISLGTIRSCQKKALIYSRRIFLLNDANKEKEAQYKINVTTTTEPSIKSTLESLDADNKTVTTDTTTDVTLSKVVYVTPTMTTIPTQFGDEKIAAEFMKVELEILQIDKQ